MAHGCTKRPTLVVHLHVEGFVVGGFALPTVTFTWFVSVERSREVPCVAAALVWQGLHTQSCEYLMLFPVTVCHAEWVDCLLAMYLSQSMFNFLL